MNEKNEKNEKQPKKTKLKNDLVLPVGGSTVFIKRVKGMKAKDGAWGEFTEDDDGNLEISIEASLTGEALSYTIAHELLHCTLHIAGHSHILDETHKGLEEAIVRCIENMFLPSLKELYKQIEENT